MKKFLLFSFLALFFTVAFQHDAFAQKKGKKKKSSKTDEYFDESGFANKLWYGGNFNLGFGGDSFSSQFSFGVTPMVGYKLVGDFLSTGPRAGFIYNNYRIKPGGSVLKSNVVSYTLGWFARVKPFPNSFPNIFGHFEYEYENTGIPYFRGGDLEVARFNFNNTYAGIGYNSGGLWAYEIMGLYNITLPDDSVANPFSIRFGLTYKF